MDFVYDVMLFISSRVLSLVRCVLDDSVGAKSIETEISETKSDSQVVNTHLDDGSWRCSCCGPSVTMY